MALTIQQLFGSNHETQDHREPRGLSVSVVNLVATRLTSLSWEIIVTAGELNDDLPT
jgi:hypothetical protein